MTDPSAHPTPAPRAFVSGTGLVFQTVGALMSIGACAAWSLSGRLTSTMPTLESWRDLFSAAHAASGALLCGLLTTFVGGIALGTIGMGLTGHTRRSGVLGAVVTFIMTAIYLTVTIILVLTPGLSAPLLISILFALICGGLFVLAVHSASLLKRYPPPPDQHRATKEFLDEHERQRLERRRRESL